DPQRLRDECEQVLEYFNVYNTIYEDVNDRGDRLCAMLQRTAEMRSALAALLFAAEGENDEIDEESEEENDNNKQSRQQRTRSRKDHEEELETTQRRRKRTIVNVSDDEE
ncbi:hypothetical protein KEM55_002251, partial [Ascosphaera atra]